MLNPRPLALSWESDRQMVAHPVWFRPWRIPAHHSPMGWSSWLVGLLDLADVGVRLGGDLAQVGPRPGVLALGNRGRPGNSGFLLGVDYFLRKSLRQDVAGAPGTADKSHV